MNFSVTQNGLPLSPSKYTWDEETRTFSTNESNLTLDFINIDGCTFNTKSYCVFNTGSGCTFNTKSYCTFTTGYKSIFNTGSGCTFDTGSDCTFNTKSYCVFNTGSECVIVRRDIFEAYQTKHDTGFNIRLNGYKVPGFTEIEEAVEMTIGEIQNALGKKIKIIE